MANEECGSKRKSKGGRARKRVGFSPRQGNTAGKWELCRWSNCGDDKKLGFGV